MTEVNPKRIITRRCQIQVLLCFLLCGQKHLQELDNVRVLKERELMTGDMSFTFRLVADEGPMDTKPHLLVIQHLSSHIFDLAL